MNTQGGSREWVLDYLCWNVMEMSVVLLPVTKPKRILTEADKNSLVPIHFKSHEVPIFIFRHLNTSANLPRSAS